MSSIEIPGACPLCGSHRGSNRVTGTECFRERWQYYLCGTRIAEKDGLIDESMKCQVAQQSALIRDLVTTLERLASCEAFKAPRTMNDEDRARIDYARAALAAVPERYKEASHD